MEFNFIILPYCTFVYSIDYKFQAHITSGAKFVYSYQPGTYIYRLDETTSIFAPKYTLDSKVYVHTPSPPSIATVFGIQLYDHPDIYIVPFSDDSVAK